MSTSDSDYSIDWLASDEEDCESPTRFSPQPPPSSTTLLTESPRNCSDSGLTQRTSDRKDGGDGCGGSTESAVVTETSGAVAAFQGLSCVCKEKASKRHSARKRAHSPPLDGFCENPQPETENELFSQKCTELQCYIEPLSSILRSLRSGRYSERLSSFQESVAMDRIQRIMGVLQNPEMGGRFLSIILKIEAMLQSWFPHMKPNVTQTDDGTPAKKQKQHHTSATAPPLSLCSFDAELVLRAGNGSPWGPYSVTHLKWLHTSPICSFKTPESMLGRDATSASPPPAHSSQRVTQDNAVSSSTDSPSGPLRRLSDSPRLSQGPVPLKISSPCLVRLLQAKESIVAPRTTGDASTSEHSWSS